jgi:hypothetical protein
MTNSDLSEGKKRFDVALDLFLNQQWLSKSTFQQ